VLVLQAGLGERTIANAFALALAAVQRGLS